MPKQAKSSTAKVRQICQEYPDEFLATPARDLRCNLCDVLVKCDKKFCSMILHTVDDILRQLEINRENLSLFLTDAARYMSLAGKTLK